MGARGPAPKPTALKLVKGERRDRVNDAEPIAESSRKVAPPEWLNETACAVWATYGPDLERQRVLTAWDLEAFAGWCDAVARRTKALERLDVEGEIVEAPVFDRNGVQTGHRMQRSEWWAVWKDADAVVQRVGARFGLSPSDRAQLKVGDGRTNSKGDDLLSG